MARNRQRAKARKQKLRRENVPGQLDEASGAVEEAEAAIVAGAAGEPVEDEDLDDAELAAEAEAAGEDDAGDHDHDADDDAGDVEEARGGRTAVATAGTPKGASPGTRLANFARGCVGELQRVQWPDRKQVGQATAVVLGFVVIAGAFLGLADAVAQQIIDLII